MPNRVLVLSGDDVGYSHRKISFLIIDELNKRGWEAQYLDLYSLSTLFSPYVKAWQIISGSNKTLWKWIFLGSNRRNHRSYLAVCRFFYRRIGKRLRRFIMENSIDRVVITLPMAVEMMNLYKKEYGSGLPVHVLVLDLSSFHYSWMADGVDHYHCANELVRETLKKRGVPNGKITVSGIPVDSRFFSCDGSAWAGNYALSFFLGGQGFSFPLSVLHKLKDAGFHERILVLCGKNEKLRKALNRKFPGIEALGFTRDVAPVLASSGMVMSRGGSATVFEILSAGRPVYLFDWMPGQEDYTVEMLETYNIGRAFHSDEELLDYLFKPRAINEFDNEKIAYFRNLSENAAAVIAEAILS